MYVRVCMRADRSTMCLYYRVMCVRMCMRGVSVTLNNVCACVCVCVRVSVTLSNVCVCVCACVCAC